MPEPSRGSGTTLTRSPHIRPRQESRCTSRRRTLAPRPVHRNRPPLITTVDADTLLYLDAAVAVAAARGKCICRGQVLDALVRRAGGEDRERAWEESQMRHGVRGDANAIRLNNAVLRRGCNPEEREALHDLIDAAAERAAKRMPERRGPGPAMGPEYQI